ncbi:MAG: hypothetical protein GZ088_09780 [Acidipila sp.]|nr:hypothetical protein [Acidipila sp.]
MADADGRSVNCGTAENPSSQFVAPYDPCCPKGTNGFYGPDSCRDGVLVTASSSNASAAQAAANAAGLQLRANPNLLSMPQPGTTPVDPNSGLFASIFKAVSDTATPLVKAQLAIEAQKAQAQGKPVYVNPALIQQASWTSKPLNWVLVGVGVLAVGAVLMTAMSGRRG